MGAEQAQPVRDHDMAHRQGKVPDRPTVVVDSSLTAPYLPGGMSAPLTVQRGLTQQQMALVQRIQETHGNQVAQRYVQRIAAETAAGANQPDVQSRSHGKQDKTAMRSTGSSLHIQREPATVIGVVGLVMGGLAIGQSQINQVSGGLVYDSDQITYPKDLARVGKTTTKSVKAAEFMSLGMFSDNKTVFNVHGEFSDSAEPPTDKNRVMANVYIDMASTTTYSKSDLSFHAKALQTPYGTPEDPKVRFACNGRFDPAGPGDVSYRAVLEVDQHGNVAVIEFEFTNGKGSVVKSATQGFFVFV